MQPNLDGETNTDVTDRRKSYCNPKHSFFMGISDLLDVDITENIEIEKNSGPRKIKSILKNHNLPEKYHCTSDKEVNWNNAVQNIDVMHDYDFNNRSSEYSHESLPWRSRESLPWRSRMSNYRFEYITPAPLRHFRLNWFPNQIHVYNVYNGMYCQLMVCLLIISSFCFTIYTQSISSEHLEEREEYFECIELGFTVAFTIEVLFNLYGSFFMLFLHDGWNLLDVILVGVTWISLLSKGAVGLSALRTFRAIRAFRGFRLMEKFQRLRTIFMTLCETILDIFWTMTILVIIAAIWAILSYELYKDVVPEYFSNWFETWKHLMKFVFDWTEPINILLFEEEKHIGASAAFVFFTYLGLQHVCILSLVSGIMYDAYLKHREHHKLSFDRVSTLQTDSCLRMESIQNDITFVKQILVRLASKDGLKIDIPSTCTQLTSQNLNAQFKDPPQEKKNKIHKTFKKVAKMVVNVQKLKKITSTQHSLPPKKKSYSIILPKQEISKSNIQLSKLSNTNSPCSSRNDRSTQSSPAQSPRFSSFIENGPDENGNRLIEI